ncbi:MAG TPA: hypothetical protein VEB67_01625 [Nitrososphaerales archaeon]|nr:hypothetical protein [Nitrososphaerales archaeon]
MDLRLRRNSSKLIVLALLVMLAAGGYLALAGAKAKIDIPISTPLTVCGESLSASLFQNETSTTQCDSVSGGWAVIDASTTYGTDMTLWMTSSNQTTTQVYSSSGSHYHLLIPLFSNGTLKVDIGDSGSPANKVSGTFTVYKLVSSDVFVPTTGHPYRTAGLVMAVVAATCLVLILLDPGKAPSRILARIKEEPQAAKTS